jgi:methylmalonyl-CoA mutase C-terminal domain/subunit
VSVPTARPQNREVKPNTSLARSTRMPKTTRRTPVRVLIAKPGLDGHDRGAKVVARALRDAGMEVIYAGLRQTPEEIVESAIEEDVDLIGLSILSGAHMALFPRILALLKKRKASDIPVFAGGIIPDEDAKRLRKIGLKAVFGPGTSLEQIVTTARGIARHRA